MKMTTEKLEVYLDMVQAAASAYELGDKDLSRLIVASISLARGVYRGHKAVIV
jgi:hypothetical protein